jgi:hypothetical protein
MNPRESFEVTRLFGTRSACLYTLLGLAVLLSLGPPTTLAQEELTYSDYRTLSWAADRMDHVTKFEPIHGEAGMYFAIGERFGTVQVSKMDGRGVSREWKSIQLSGVPDELLVADLDGDGLDDSLLCRTNPANLDDDQANEIVLLADNRIVYVDGASFVKGFTSINEYTATQIRCGDVDGDSRVEIVLNSGQVVDSVSGDIEWEDEPFFAKIELLDINGDGFPEILTENPGNGPLKVFDGGHRSEVRFQ